MLTQNYIYAHKAAVFCFFFLKGEKAAIRQHSLWLTVIPQDTAGLL